jgi:hypothetical protein
VARDDPRRAALAERVAGLIDTVVAGERADDARDALLEELGAWQAEHVVPYGRLVAARARSAATHPRQGVSPWPALPTDVFRMVRVSSYDEPQDVRVFRTSGTTSGDRGAHAFRDLTLYDHAARAAADLALFPDLKAARESGEPHTMRLVVLAPREEEAPDSSLSYMLARFAEWYGDPDERGVTYAFSRDAIDARALREALERATHESTPVAILGTSFAFVYGEDALDAQRFALPPGSRIMQTGGFKGRTREVVPEQMRALLAARYGVPDSHIVAEYGMTELSSQLYETTLAAALRGEQDATRALWVPGWMRATLVDPDTLAPVPAGVVGVLRLDDPANLDSVCAIQTADLGRQEPSGIVLLGRAPGAVPRGCSLAVEEALAARGRADE